MKDELGVQLEQTSTEDQLIHNVIDVAGTCVSVMVELIIKMEKLA